MKKPFLLKIHQFQLSQLRVVALDRHQSVAEIIRQSIDRFMQVEMTADQRTRAEQLATTDQDS